MDFHQIFIEILGFPWMIPQEFPCKSLDLHGNPRIFMDFSPNSLGNPRISMDFSPPNSLGNHQNFWEILGVSWMVPQIPSEILGFSWIFPKFPGKS